MKKYLINISGHNGDPGGNYDYHFKANEVNLREKLIEELSENYPLYENECKDNGIEKFIDKIIENGGCSWENYGYGTSYNLEIEEL